MQLNVTTDLTVIPHSIEWNYEELKTQLVDRLEYYKNLVVTEDGIKAAKSDKAKLNLLKSAIEEKRKEVKRTCLAPYEAFEQQCKELVRMIQAPISSIDTQIKNFDEQRKQAKYAELKEHFKEIIGDLEEIVQLDNVLNPKWGNATAKISALKQELTDKVHQCRSEIDTLQKQFADKPYLSAIIAKYSESCSLSATLVYATYLQAEDEKQKRIQAEREARSQQIEKSHQPDAAVQKTYVQDEAVQMQPDAMAQIREEIVQQQDPVGSVAFCVTCTRSQLIELRDYMQKAGIQYKVIR